MLSMRIHDYNVNISTDDLYILYKQQAMQCLQ